MSSVFVPRETLGIVHKLVTIKLHKYNDFILGIVYNIYSERGKNPY